VKGTWREGSLAGYPEGYVEKTLQTGISFHRGPVGEPGGGLIYWGPSEMDEGGSRDGASLSEEAPWRWPWWQGRAPLLETLEDMLRKAPDTGISVHRGPFTTEGNLESGGGSLTRDFER